MTFLRSIRPAFCLGFLSLAWSLPARAEIKSDEEIIRILLEQDLGKREFPFPSVIKAATGQSVLPFNPNRDPHQRIARALRTAIGAAIRKMNRPDSPVRGLRRINEASRFFEDEIQRQLEAADGVECTIPLNAEGRHQRVGYPDLRIIDQKSGEVFYLDPKLVERGSIDSTLRTFYFEPRRRSGKILDDAVHLLVGIEHDGNDGKWTFLGWRQVDLATVSLRLKAEFQTSNAGLYRNSSLSKPPGGDQTPKSK